MRFWKSYICSDKLHVSRNKLQFRTVQQNQKSSIFLDAGLRLDGIPAHDLWDLIVLVLGNTTQNHNRTGRPVVNTSEICSPPHTIHKRKRSRRLISDLDNVRPFFSKGSFVVCV